MTKREQIIEVLKRTEVDDFDFAGQADRILAIMEPSTSARKAPTNAQDIDREMYASDKSRRYGVDNLPYSYGEVALAKGKRRIKPLDIQGFESISAMVGTMAVKTNELIEAYNKEEE